MKKILLLFGMFITLIFPLNVNASSANINIVNNPKTINNGGVITTTVTVSSSSKIGTVDYYLSYTDNLKLISGDAHKVDYAVGGKSSVTYTYKFKAIQNGSGKVYIENKNIMDVNGDVLSVSVSPSTTNIISEVSSNLSKNCLLSSLEVEGLKFKNKFNKNEFNYDLILDKEVSTINIKAIAEDNKAVIDGIGKYELKEGENVFEIKVTAEDGSEKNYFITAMVEEKNAIKVKVNGKEYIIVKDEELVKNMAPEDYEKNVLKINDIEVPVLKGTKTKLNLVVARDSEDNYVLLHYDKKEDKYYEYLVMQFNDYSLYIIPAPFIPNNTLKTRLSYDDEKIVSYVDKKNENIYYLYAMDINTGKKNWYKYNSETNDIEIVTLQNSNKTVIYIISGIVLLLLIIALILLIKKVKK